MKYNQDLQEIINNFAILENWEDKYTYIIELGKQLIPLEEKYKNQSNKVAGCISKVWLIHRIDKGRLYFQADSDAYIVKGLITILMKILSGKTAKEIIDFEIEELFQILQLKEHLTSGRSNGFFAIANKIKAIAENNL